MAYWQISSSSRPHCPLTYMETRAPQVGNTPVGKFPVGISLPCNARGPSLFFFCDGSESTNGSSCAPSQECQEWQKVSSVQELPAMASAWAGGDGGSPTEATATATLPTERFFFSIGEYEQIADLRNRGRGRSRVLQPKSQFELRRSSMPRSPSYTLSFYHSSEEKNEVFRSAA